MTKERIIAAAMSQRDAVRPAPGRAEESESAPEQNCRPRQHAALHMQQAPFTAEHATEDAASMVVPKAMRRRTS